MTDSSEEPSLTNLAAWKDSFSCSMRINWLLGLGIILGLIGASLMVAFGVLYVKPYTQVKSMKETVCMTWNVTITGDVVTCTCASSDGRASCLSRYPCVKVWVNFTTEEGAVVTNATLYDSHNTFFLQRPAQQCSYHQCDRSPGVNLEGVERFMQDKGTPGSVFSCFYEPSDLSYAIRSIVRTSVVVHCMLWPSLAFVVGAVILFAHVCDWGGRSSTSPGSSPFNSLEKPWLRHVERNYEKVHALSDHQREEEGIHAHDNTA